MSNFRIDQVNSSDSDSFPWVTESGFSISIRGYLPEESVIVNGCIKNLWTPSYFLKKITTEALKIMKQGLSVFSTKSDKTPVIKITDRIVGLRTKPQTEKELEIDFSHANVAGIAINCGPVVGQNKDLECLDIDCPKIAKTFLPDLKALNPDLNSILTKCVEETPSEGLHIFYYTPLGSSKCKDLASMSEEAAKAWLAESKAKGSIKKVAPPLIETKGEGGYVVGFYSQAVSKIDGLVKPYKMLHGDVSTIPTINADQHDFLMSFAKSHDEKVTEKTLYEFDNSNQSDEKKAAIHQWRAETPWSEVLPDTYRVVEVRHDYFLIWHPDSSGREPNAIAGCKNGGMDRYWNFSPLDWRLSANIPLTKDWVYTQSRGLIKGDPDWKKFYSEIFKKYNSDNLTNKSRRNHIAPVSNLTKINEMFETWEAVNAGDNNIVGRMQQDILETNPGNTKSLILAGFPPLTILAHAFRDFTGSKSSGGKIKPIIHQIVLAPTGTGKNHPNLYLGNFFTCLQKIEIDRTLTVDAQYIDSIANMGGTWQGIEDLLGLYIRILLIQDEIGTMWQDRSEAFIGTQRIIREMHSAKQHFFLRAKAKITTGGGLKAVSGPPTSNYVGNPILNLLCFGQEEVWVPALTQTDFTDGTFGRYLVARETRIHWSYKDGTKNKPKRKGAPVSMDIVESVFQRKTEIKAYLEERGIESIPVSKDYEDYLIDKSDQDYDKHSKMEDDGTFRGAIDGRGTENAERVALIHYLGRLDSSMEISAEDLDYGFRVVNNSLKVARKIGDLVLGSVFQKEINAFMRALSNLKGKPLTRSNVLRNWSCAKERNADWVKSTLEPELEKLGRLRVTDKISGTYEVQE